MLWLREGMDGMDLRSGRGGFVVCGVGKGNQGRLVRWVLYSRNRR